MNKLFCFLAFLAVLSFPLFSEEKQVADFTLNFYDDMSSEFTLHDNLGQKTQVFIFFATWCGGCKEEVPQVNAISKNYPDVEFRCISYREKPETIASFFGQNSISLQCLIDKDGKVFKQFGISSIPALLVVGKDGGQKMLGHHSVEELETLLKSL